MSTGSGQVDETLPATLRALCPPVCVECDYSLVGLPAETNCPECGARCNPHTITLCGWSPLSLATARRGQMTGYVVAAVLFATLIARDLIWLRRTSEMTLVILGLLILYPLFQIFRRWFLGVDSHRPMRLRLCRDGFEQRLGPGKLKLTRWDPRMVVKLSVGARGHHSLVVTWSPASFVLTTKSQLINFDFDSDPNVARLLAAQLQQWINRV
jgi:hypothetical protein